MINRFKGKSYKSKESPKGEGYALMASSLGGGREEEVLYIFTQFHNYHINFISLLNIFEDSDFILGRRKARAACCSSPSERLGEALYSSFSESFYFISISEKRGLCVDGLLFWRRSGGGLLGPLFHQFPF
jgi:hypothetical protein